MNNIKQQYVLGFMFDEDKSRVALITKTKPDWQAGLKNGIDGKINDGELAYQAMVREFKEETGVEVLYGWKFYCQLYSDKFDVMVYANTGDLTQLQTTTDEVVSVLDIKDIHRRKKELITNLPWLIEMALDKLNNNEFNMGVVNY